MSYDIQFIAHFRQLCLLAHKAPQHASRQSLPPMLPLHPQPSASATSHGRRQRTDYESFYPIARNKQLNSPHALFSVPCNCLTPTMLRLCPPPHLQTTSTIDAQTPSRIITITRRRRLGRKCRWYYDDWLRIINDDATSTSTMTTGDTKTTTSMKRILRRGWTLCQLLTRHRWYDEDFNDEHQVYEATMPAIMKMCPAPSPSLFTLSHTKRTHMTQ